MREDVTQIAVDDLHVDPTNVNVHNDANLAQIEASVERFGFIDPIGVVERPEGGYTVVEGHGRLIVAQRLKLAELPCIVLTLDDVERRGYGIAHNQIQRINTLDLGVVSEEFNRLGVTNEDFTSLGFSSEDALFLPVVDPGNGDAFSAPGGGDYKEPSEDDDGEPDKFQAFIPVIHRTELRFASEVGLNRFVSLLTLLRGHYPTAGTHAERLMLFMKDRGLVTEGTGADGTA